MVFLCFYSYSNCKTSLPTEKVTESNTYLAACMKNTKMMSQREKFGTKSPTIVKAPTLN